MIRTRIIKDVTGTIDLCETYSTDKHKLLQVGTDILYDDTVTDIIAGYDDNGNPYSRYTYEETDELVQEIDESEVKTDAE